MSILKLAANSIDAVTWFGFGHLQIVYEGIDGLYEVEVQSPWNENIITWEYPPVRIHSDLQATPHYGEFGFYSEIVIDLGDRLADDVWSLITTIRDQFAANGDFIYGLNQNSNSFAATVLYMVGVDVAGYLSSLYTAFMGDFPGAQNNVILGDDLSFSLAGTGGADVIRTGGGADKLLGLDGKDTLTGGDGDDILIGGSLAGPDEGDEQWAIETFSPGSFNWLDDQYRWDDRKRDLLSGGEGHDRYYIYSDRVRVVGGISKPDLNHWIREEIDLIDALDTDFTAHFQWKWGEELYHITITEEDLAAATPDLELPVSVEIDGEEHFVYGEVMGQLLILYLSVGNSEYQAVLGGFYNYGVDPQNPPTTPGTDTGPYPGNPSNQPTQGWLGVDDIVTTAINATVNFNVLANDVMPAGVVGEPSTSAETSHGYLEWDGVHYTYVPHDDFSGADTFVYRAWDSDGDGHTQHTIGFVYVGNVTQNNGTDGNDALTGTAGKNAFNGGQGDDALVGGAGSDTYLYVSGGGSDTITDQTSVSDEVDVLRFVDLYDRQLHFTRAGSDLVVSIMGTEQTIRVFGQFSSQSPDEGVERIEFVDGTYFDEDYIGQFLSRINGTEGADILTGTSGDDVLYGNLGNDAVSGGAGSDTYIYQSGDGNDTIQEKDDSTIDVDILFLEWLDTDEVTFSRSGEDLLIADNYDGSTITVAGQFLSQTENWGIEAVEFGDGGPTWDLSRILAEAAVRGTNGADVLESTNWNDTFVGGGGADRFVFNGTVGHDSVNDFSEGDLIEIGSSFHHDFSALISATTQIGSDSVIQLNPSNTVTLKDVSKASLSQDDFLYVA